MNFEQIKSFVSVVECGTYSRAAKERFLTQPAISNHIKGLEDEIGTSLFVRSGKAISLTAKGEIFYRYAKKLLSVEKMHCRI